MPSQSCRSTTHFNPRACVRHDKIRRMASDDAVFQSTCLREARPLTWDASLVTVAFQSTCLREARLGDLLGPQIDSIFQSTCLREARLTTRSPSPGSMNFNPRACVRHDENSDGVVDVLVISIHVPA